MLATPGGMLTAVIQGAMSADGTVLEDTAFPATVDASVRTALVASARTLAAVRLRVIAAAEDPWEGEATSDPSVAATGLPHEAGMAVLWGPATDPTVEVDTSAPSAGVTGPLDEAGMSVPSVGGTGLRAVAPSMDLAASPAASVRTARTALARTREAAASVTLRVRLLAMVPAPMVPPVIPASAMWARSRAHMG